MQSPKRLTRPLKEKKNSKGRKAQTPSEKVLSKNSGFSNRETERTSTNYMTSLNIDPNDQTNANEHDSPIQKQSRKNNHKDNSISSPSSSLQYGIHFHKFSHSPTPTNNSYHKKPFNQISPILSSPPSPPHLNLKFKNQNSHQKILNNIHSHTFVSQTLNQFLYSPNSKQHSLISPLSQLNVKKICIFILFLLLITLSAELFHPSQKI
jgi:hypothetical protein